MMRYAPPALVIGIAILLSGCSEQMPANSPAVSEKPLSSAPAPPAPAKEKPVQPPAAWQTYHGNASLDGAANVSLPDTLTMIWKADVAASILNTPVVGSNRVCVADTKGTVHAFDLAGKPVWSKTFNEPAEPGREPRHVGFDAPLALFDSTVVAGTSSGTVYALNASDGEIRWKCETEWPILGTPNVADVRTDTGVQKRLFVIDQSEGGLQCIDFATGQKLWKGDSVSRCDGSPAVSESVAVYGSCAGAVHIFSTVDGKMLREIALDEDSQIAGGAVLLGDLIYSGSRSGKFIHANAATGEMIWSNTDCQAESFSTPAVGAGRIVFTASDSVVYALDREAGKLQWKKELEGTLSSPVIANDKVLVSAGGSIFLLRLADGETLWSFPVSDELTSPALAGTLVIVGGDDGTVTAFGPKTGEQ
jgi:outer membrane protein assembly factor BamB